MFGQAAAPALRLAHRVLVTDANSGLNVSQQPLV
jgi:hypothetical protein